MEKEEYDNEEEEEYVDENYDRQGNVAIIVIDICASMFDDPKPIKKCLAAVYQQYDQMLLQGYHRNISVCILKDDDIIVTALNDNLIESTKKILDLLKSTTDELRQQFERKSPASLRFTLSECMKQFKNLDKINPYIVLLTTDDDPHNGDKTENLSAIDVALSLKEMNIKLVVLPLKENFNYDLFYRELLKAANDVPLLEIFESETDQSYTTVDELVNILKCIIKDKVNLRRYIFRLCEEKNAVVEFWVQIHYLVKSNNLYANCNICRETNNAVKLEFESRSDIDVHQLIFSKDGSEEILIRKNECLEYTMPYGFRLLKVVTESQIRSHYINKKGFLMHNDIITPENEKIQQLFDCIWNFCNEKKRFLICGFFIPGNRQHPHKVQLTPDRFYGKPCFIGQILFNIDEVAESEDEDEETNKSDSLNNLDLIDKKIRPINDMINKMTIKNFSPDQISSYVYEKKAAIIKAQLLDTEQPEVNDSIPSEEEVVNKLGEKTSEDLCQIFGSISQPVTKKKKK